MEILRDKKIKIFFSVSIIMLVGLSIFFYFPKHSRALEVDFLDVGQGDSELIKTPFGQNILIDGGPDKTVIKRLGENLPFWDRKIDLMILTHPHDDHVGGLVEVVKRYEVGKILYTGVVHTGPNYLAWLEAVRDKHIPVTIIDHPQKISLGKDCFLDILYPEENLAGKAAGNLNNTSIVAKLVYGQTDFLLAGDSEKDIEHRLVAEGAELHADVFKADHHGSDTSNTQEFLDAVHPQLIAIEVGKDNPYGHPAGRTLNRMEKTGAHIYRTDQDGTVRILSDGKNISIRE